MRFEVGQKAGDYEFLAVVANTPTGVTYHVRNALADRQELLKVLPRDLQDDPERTERFLREAKIHARLSHPNIAAFYNATRIDDQLVMTTELVEGTSLEQRLAGGGSLSLEQAKRYFEQALSALSYAHREGIVHRDLNPAHLVIGPHDTIKVTGFGLAKKASDPQLTQPGIVLGSVHYMSPEQVKGSSELDRRSDLYSLGIVLYEAVTGKKPFDSKSQFEVFLAHVNQEPIPPSNVRPEIPPQLDQIILTAMAKQPIDRFQTAEEFRESLGKLQWILETPTAPEAAAPQPQRQSAVSEPRPGEIEQVEQIEPAVATEPPSKEKPQQPAAANSSPGPDPTSAAWPGRVHLRETRPTLEALLPPPAEASGCWDELPRDLLAADSQTSQAATSSSEKPADVPQQTRWNRDPGAAPFSSSAAEQTTAATGTGEYSKPVPILLRPTGDTGGYPRYSAPVEASPTEPEASEASWFGDQVLAGWTSKDILAVGALMFVIVAAVFFVLLTFLNYQ